MKYTKGPWRLWNDVYPDEPRDNLVIMGEKQSAIGGYQYASCGGPDWKANAYLISAAPDLLEALDLMMDALEATEAMCQGEDGSLPAGFIPNAWSKARKAIKKANGEPT